MVTETTKPNECGINGTLSTLTFAPASAFISVSQTQRLDEYITLCDFQVLIYTTTSVNDWRCDKLTPWVWNAEEDGCWRDGNIGYY